MLTPAFTPFPTLRTERLLLRDHTPADVEPLFRIRSDERTMQFIARPRASTLEDAADLIARMQRDRGTNEGLGWAIALADTGAMIGGIGLYRLKLEHHCAEVGYQLDPDHWGQGYMAEALEAVTQHTLGPLGFHRIEAITDPRNTRSRDLLERCGYAFEGIQRENFLWEGEFLDSALYARLAR